MKVRLSDADLKEIIFERELPHNFKSEQGIEEASFEMDYRFGKASVHEQWFEGIHINDGIITFREPLLMRMESSDPVIEMHFSLSGASNVRVQGFKEKFAF